MTDHSNKVFWEVVLTEDDCAPDAREYFNREFRQYSALDVATFKSLAQHKESNDGLTLSWVLGGVELSISADDPFYVVRKRRIFSPKSDMNSTKEPSDPIRVALDRLHDYAVGHPNHDTDEIVAAARAALAAAPEGEPSDQELRDLWSWSSGQDQGPWPTQYHCFARAVLSRWGRPAAPPATKSLKERADFIAGYREGLADGKRISEHEEAKRRPATPPAPLEGEVGELISVIESCAGFTDESTPVGEVWAKIVALLEQLSAAAPAVVPIPVSERLPEPEDCDVEGRCWIYQPWEMQLASPQWTLLSAKYASANYGATHWLPAHAIPLPQQPNK